MRKSLLYGTAASALLALLIWSPSDPRGPVEPTRRDPSSAEARSSRPAPSAVSGAMARKESPAAAPAQVPASPAQVAGAQAFPAAPGEPVFSVFSRWTQAYADAKTSGEKRDLEPAGVVLAARRREALSGLIRENPRAALALAMPEPLRRGLPAPVLALLEEPLNGKGDLRALAVCGEEEGHVERTAVLGGRVFRAFVAGERPARTLSGATLSGIALDGDAALYEPLEIQALASGGEETAPSTTTATATTTAAAPQVRTALFMRCNFPDDLREPQTFSAAQSLMNDSRAWFERVSYGKATLQGTVTPTLTISRASHYYTLINNAINAARAAGFTANYTHYILSVTSDPTFVAGGFATLGGSYVWMQGTGSLKTLLHELGHNLGLMHAKSFRSNTVIGEGISDEYGNSFCTMGIAHYNPPGDFLLASKATLGWVETSDLQFAQASGTYRLHALESPIAAGAHGLRVPTSSAYYSLEFRQAPASVPAILNGVLVYRNEQLLDTTPRSPGGVKDAALVIGRTFSDPAGVHITPIRKNGTTPESVDVVLNLGTFPQNLAPILQVGASRSLVGLPSGAAVTFTASATDPNGDALAYAWDFGDGSFGPNAPAATKSWTAPGDYLVHCTVSDMKGGVACRNLLVTVGPRTAGKYRVSGRVLGDVGPLADVLVAYTDCAADAYPYVPQVGASLSTRTDSDGAYTLVNVPAPASGRVYEFQAYRHLFNLRPDGFSNPLTPQADLAGIGFSTPDAVAPTVQVTTPSSSPFHAGSSQWIRIAGTAQDNRGVAQVICLNQTLGYGGAADGTGSWSTYILLLDGSNTIQVQARDAAGNLGTASFTVVTDQAPPALAITGPTSNPTWSTTDSAITLSGSVSDASGLQSIAWQNAATGQGGTASQKSATNWFASVPLARGDNAITVRATDIHGNTSSRVITVNSRPVIPLE